MRYWGTAILLASLCVGAQAALADAPKADKPEYEMHELNRLGIQIDAPPSWQMKKGFRSAEFYEPLSVSSLPQDKREDLEVVAAMLRRAHEEGMSPQTRGRIAMADREAVEGLEHMMRGVDPKKLDAPGATLHKAVFRIETTSMADKDPAMSVQELAAPYLQADRQGREAFKILDDRDLIMADMVAVRYITSFKRKAWPSDAKASTFKEMLYFLNDGTNLFRVTCTTLEPTDFDHYRPTFERMAKSFDFLGLF